MLSAQFDERPLRFAMAEGGPRIALIMGRPLDILLSAARNLEPRKESKPADTKPTDTKAADAKSTGTEAGPVKSTF
jgi:hypothetical protein